MKNLRGKVATDTVAWFGNRFRNKNRKRENEMEGTWRMPLRYDVLYFHIFGCTSKPKSRGLENQFQKFRGIFGLSCSQIPRSGSVVLVFCTILWTIFETAGFLRTARNNSTQCCPVGCVQVGVVAKYAHTWSQNIPFQFLKQCHSFKYEAVRGGTRIHDWYVEYATMHLADGLAIQSKFLLSSTPASCGHSL